MKIGVCPCISMNSFNKCIFFKHEDVIKSPEGDRWLDFGFCNHEEKEKIINKFSKDFQSGDVENCSFYQLAEIKEK